MDSFGLWSLFFSSFISSTLLPGGSEVLLGYLVSEQVYPFSVVVAIASLGNTLGGLVTLLMGWLLAIKLPFKALQKKRHLQVQQQLTKYGPVCLLLSWLPVIGDPLCFVAGWLRLALLPSILLIMVGKTLRYLVIGLAVS
ncbi:YqaA family protein [Amphritea sp. HPY]|uniref:YqaA family protein n=1 Tax=Amphritea sp. HPY TaxID=3421652 RepID=UPI003D7DFF8E